MNKETYWRKELERIGDALDLDDGTREVAGAFFQTCEITEKTRGWSVDEVLTACIYLAVRELYVPVSMREIADTTSIRKREIAQCFRFLVKELDLTLDPEEPEKFVPEYIKRLNEEHDAKLGEETEQAARNLISIATGHGELPGCAPTSIAAGAVYVATEAENKKVTQTEIAEVSGVAPGTIRRVQEPLRNTAQQFDWV